MKTQVAVWYSAFMVACFICAGCQNQSPKVAPSTSPCDTSVFSIQRDSLRDVIASKDSTLSELKQKYDSARSESFNSGFTVTQVKKYVRIVQHNRAQEKFLLGWVSRAVGI